MSKHTPGPWYQVGAWVEVEDDKTPDICTCNPADIGQDRLKWDWETVKANAMLIAAAPDLLDALLAALPFVEDAADDETYKAHRVHKVLKEIRNAIEKATGESCTS